MSKPTQKSKRIGLRSYISFMLRHKLRLVVTLGVYVLSSTCLAVIPFFIGKLVGALAANPVHGHQAVLLTWTLVGLSFVHSATWRLGEYLYMKLLKPLSHSYENLLFHTVITKPYPYFVDKFTGKVSSYITTISQEMRGLTEDLCYNYVGQLVSLLSLIVIMTTVNWQTGLIFFVGLVIMLLVGRLSIRKSVKYEGVFADVQSTKNGKIIDIIANFVNVKSFHTEAREAKAVAKEQTKTLTSANQSFLWSMWFWSTMSFLVRELIWPVTIGLNVYLFLHHQLTITQLATLLSAILLFSTTIWESVWYISQFTLRTARVEEAHSYLFGAMTVRDAPLATSEQTESSFTSSLTFSKLHFAYPDKPDVAVLSNINLTIKKGEKIGIVGKSGSGKTTLTKLLLDYYEVDGKTLVLDGKEVGSAQIAQLVSYVPQDTSLFHRTIAENIAYASDRDVSFEEVVAAARQAHADEFISKITDGYEALVGERGVKLSAGQRQRIAIARAFLDDKPILVLDEATSALDSESEILVQQALEALWEHKTVIAIAHRLSTLRHMDRIIVIDKGTVIEQGTHAELLKSGGAYAKLWNHQSGGFLEE